MRKFKVSAVAAGVTTCLSAGAADTQICTEVDLSVAGYGEVALSDTTLRVPVCEAVGMDELDPKRKLELAESDAKKNPVDFFGMREEVEGDNLVGVYMRGKLPVDKFLQLSKIVQLSGTVGYTHAELATDPDEEPATESDVSYGFGAKIGVGAELSVSVDYMQFMDRPEYQHTGVNFGLQGSF